MRGPGLEGAGASLGIKGGVPEGTGDSLPTHDRERSPQRVSFLSDCWADLPKSSQTVNSEKGQLADVVICLIARVGSQLPDIS